MYASIRETWQKAYETASFYRSEQNTAEYWDRVAETGSSGLDGDSHISLLLDYLTANNILCGDESYNTQITMLDVGCGTGDYSIRFAPFCAKVTALDSSFSMLERCRIRAEDGGYQNIECIKADFMRYETQTRYDIVLAALNPATYCPGGFDKLIGLSKKYIVYMSMDLPIEGDVNEPIYCATNSIRYPEKYMLELGIPTTIIPFTYEVKINDTDIRKISMPFLVCDVENSIRI